MSARRIEVDVARRKVQAGEALLVCAYDDEDKCHELALDGAISLAELQRRQVGHEAEIIFYCA